ncbi:phosphonate ABC transporter ATP-binding protein [Aquisalimonas asiatica]|uniref:Phosphonate transport system ATP-binding protein n=1 Tax=Aquisalimonas asiatica TaxID=406100 RepID=A0A1H8RRE5_9GAMM|nr:phosphonate ABC transporter ATP-binding protein [Aquisalimonas asiatica]SEO69189.1 phosphonate transport system ATP-binding protein [Aquisalimonas asiatica]
MSVIHADNVHKRFGKVHVLRGIAFRIPEREGAILLGANGCGKSTLMRCMNGLARPEQGSIHVHGSNVANCSQRKLREVRRGVGMVFQNFNLVGNLSVFQNVLYGGLARHRSFFAITAPLASREERAYAMHCLERVQLARCADQRADQLSGGQQQRVAIARVLMQRPSVVLADEPVASLDPKAAREVMNLLWGVVREEGMTLLCTLHQLDFAMEYGDRVIGMKAGHVQVDRPMGQTSRDELQSLYEGNVRVDETPSDAVTPLRRAS